MRSAQGLPPIPLEEILLLNRGAKRTQALGCLVDILTIDLVALVLNLLPPPVLESRFDECALPAGRFHNQVWLREKFRNEGHRLRRETRGRLEVAEYLPFAQSASIPCTFPASRMDLPYCSRHCKALEIVK